ncbi:PQ loop repeat protein [Metamycoplasma subdolum]|uniref:PQ loop repeat protein n=1 Tax=Metamycoplasma subdolum TaxID=92407 RepID=A0A3M0A260_9BACT|nr:PQ-loop domain-containing transporter [Metamycoplasma subdolum]RMA77549.1 PQ loop repeat protein [Metamycoplasma subdolum]WPB50343.1 PQ-loop domain-containing transporter [Metamycoplasma subdolum]
METAIQIFGVLGALTTVGLGIPQLVHQIKTKHTPKVNFLSFWIFYIGILIWVVFGAFDPNGLWQVFGSNLLCILIYTATIYYLYKYYPDKKKNTMALVWTGIAIIMSLCAIVSGIYIYKLATGDKRFDISKEASTVIGAIAPALSTLAFLPQTIIALKRKSFEGVSPYMPLVFLINNAWWTTQFSLIIASGRPDAISVIPPIIWQVISSIVYGFQFIAIQIWRTKQKKLKALEEAKTTILPVEIKEEVLPASPSMIKATFIEDSKIENSVIQNKE